MKNNQIARALNVQEICRDKVSVWFGSRDNYYHPFKEVFANSIDEITENFENGVITVWLSNDNQTLTILDTGRGLRLFDKTEDGRENYILLFETIFAGGKYDDNADRIGTNGVGLTAINNTSTHFKAISYHDDKEERVIYSNGNLIEKEECSTQHNQHGTIIEFALDNKVYTNITYDTEEIEAIIRAFCGVTNSIKCDFYLNGELKQTYEYKSLREYYDDVTSELTCNPIGSVMTTYDLKEEYIKIEGQIGTSVKPTQQTFLNRSLLTEGGTIVAGAIDGIIEACNEYATKNKMFSKGVKAFTKKDIEDGCSFIISVLSNKFEYANQTKLSTKKVAYRRYTKEYVKSLLMAEMVENESNFRKFIKHLLTINKMNDNNDKLRKKINRELKTKVNCMGKRPDKLTDCNAKYIGAGKGGEFYICEGDSAKGTAVDARDPRLFQAIYPIRGKILNVLKASLKDAINNEIIKQIFQIIGTGIGEDFDINTRRYDKIVITADQDNDGFQIRQLVISVLWKFTPQLILNGHVYIAETPLYEIKVKGEKSIYVYSESEKDRVIEGLNKPYKLSRAKG